MRQWLSPRVLVVALLAIGVARIVSTYHVFNQTWDEPAHVAAGWTAASIPTSRCIRRWPA